MPHNKPSNLNIMLINAQAYAYYHGHAMWYHGRAELLKQDELPDDERQQEKELWTLAANAYCKTHELANTLFNHTRNPGWLQATSEAAYNWKNAVENALDTQ